MPKLVMMPPQRGERLEWAKRLAAALPDYQVVTPQTDEEAAREIVDADAVFGRVAPELLPSAKKLLWMQSPAAGPPAGYYYRELVDHPVTITNLRGVYNDHIAQHILMFVLALARGLPFYVDAQQRGVWDHHARKSRYIDLKTATALIVGVGGIGHETARLCNAFGMRVIGIDPRWEFDPPNVERHSPAETDALLPSADFVITTTPHTPETEGFWTAARFSLMKPSAYFINIGRGMTTKLDDLVAALEKGTIAGAALDVYEIEPLPAGHKLWSLPNVLLTPHVAALDAEDVSDRQYDVVLENARRFASGQPLRNVVDKANWF
jgi:phosphoglycerate dehydrogenase-like enzyme